VTGSTHPNLPPSLHNGQHNVALSERDIAEAKRLLAIIAGAEPDVRPTEHERAPAQEDQDRLKPFARQLYEQRQKRIGLFGSQMFGEPAWEMLLILYLDEGSQRVLQTRLTELSGATRSTAARWIDYLIGRGFVRREGHPTDKRRSFVSLTDKGRNLLELYLSETFG
jgi:DNA-binding MarR family transcriptional regulator